ncbi:hypothetical protein COBT_003805 [Conglomerata obtusa]
MKEGNKEFWISDNGLKREMPEINERKELVVNIHEKSNHRGIESVYYELKKEYYWIGMKKTIENVIKKCETCAQINRKNKCGYIYIETKRPLQKVGVDIIDFRAYGYYVVVAIDYFTRYVYTKVITDKKAETIKDTIEE